MVRVEGYGFDISHAKCPIVDFVCSQNWPEAKEYWLYTIYLSSRALGLEAALFSRVRAPTEALYSGWVIYKIP